MTYGWELMHILNHVSSGDSTLESIDKYMLREKNRFGKDDYRVYFLTNHDENSWNGTVEERYGAAEKAYAALAFTINGMPLVYSGQEYGNNKRLEFFEKDNPNNVKPELFEFYSALMKLNVSNSALWNGKDGGDYERIKTNSDENIFVIKRQNGESIVVSIVNLSKEEQKFNIQIEDELSLKDVFSNEKTLLNKDIEITLPAYGFLVLEK